ncbi:MAG: hypothetical protein OEN21_00870 [Myxococcales bacterium]|nr:hypothetical protein [Myxococcales bacterium]
MNVVALWIGAVLVLGCQERKEAPSSADSSGVAEVVEEEAKTEAPEPEDSAPSEPAPESPPEFSALVSKVMGLTQMRTVEETDTGIKITFPLEASPKVDEQSPPQTVSDAMMFAAFYTAPLLYDRTEDVDGLQLVFNQKEKRVGEINMTRASFQSLGYDEVMAGATDEKSKRRAYRTLLAKLPKGAVKIRKKYRP